MSIAFGPWPVIAATAAALVLGLVGLAASRSTDPLRHVRGRLWLALGTFGLALLAGWVWSVEQASLLGLPLVVAPGAAAGLGVLAFALPPAHAAGGGRTTRMASIRPRSAGRVLGGRSLIVPGALLAALVAILITTGITADRAGSAAGRAFSVVRPGLSAGGGPYPGWFYGGPILLSVAFLVGAVAIAVRRTVLLPAVSPDEVLDDAWRARVGRALGAIATAGLLLYLAGVLWASSVAWKILAETGTSGLEAIASVQRTLCGLAVIAALAVIVVAAIRVASVGRVVVRGSVAA